MPIIGSRRPRKLTLYSQRLWLERSLALGEFRLRPSASTGAGGRPHPTILTLSLSQTWNESAFELFADADCCLIIHDTEEFGERIHRAAQNALPSWAGIDAAVSYGVPSPLGAAFSKNRADAARNEWLFAWRPAQSGLSPNPIFIQIGSIEDIAELRNKGAADTLLH